MRLFSRAYFDTLFTIGLLLAVTVNLNRQYLFLPDFVSGFFTGLSLMLLLLAGSLRYIKPLQKRLSIAASDERIQIIKGRAFESAYAAALLAGTAAVVILGFFGEPYYYISFGIAGLLFLESFIFGLAKVVLPHKM